MERVGELHRRQMLQSYNLMLATSIVDLLNDIMIEQCYGCSVNQTNCKSDATPMYHGNFFNAFGDVLRTDFRESEQGVYNEEVANGNRCLGRTI